MTARIWKSIISTGISRDALEWTWPSRLHVPVLKASSKVSFQEGSSPSNPLKTHIMTLVYYEMPTLNPKIIKSFSPFCGIGYAVSLNESHYGNKTGFWKRATQCNQDIFSISMYALWDLNLWPWRWVQQLSYSNWTENRWGGMLVNFSFTTDKNNEILRPTMCFHLFLRQGLVCPPLWLLTRLVFQSERFSLWSNDIDSN